MAARSTGVAPTVSNRWLIAVAGVVMQLALGGIYAWSVFVTPLLNAHLGPDGKPIWTKTEVGWTFSFALLAIGFAAALGGFWLPKTTPRVVASVGGVLFGLGLLAASQTRDMGLPMLYLTYGLLGGIGAGLAYIVPIATLIGWFPDKRGLITGLAVAGFGGGAALAAPVGTELVKPGNLGVYPTFAVFGIVYLVLIVAAAQFLQRAPAGYAPPHWTVSPKAKAQNAADFEFASALRTWQWYALWAILFLNVIAGATLIAQASPMAQSIAGENATTAGILVIVISVFNALGRLFWASTSDRIGRARVFQIMFVLQFIVFGALALIVSNAGKLALVPLAALIAVVALCYGGGFGTMPAFAADYFGPKRSGVIYGAMLTAWGFGGVVGPFIMTSLIDANNPTHAAVPPGNSFTPGLFIICGIMLVSTVLPFIIRAPGQNTVRRVAAPSRA